MNQAIPAVSMELPSARNGNFMMPGGGWGSSGTEMYSDVSANRNYQGQTFNNMYDGRQQCRTGSIGIDGACCCPNSASSAPFQSASGTFQRQKPTLNDLSITMPAPNQKKSYQPEMPPLSDAARVRIERQMPPNWLNQGGMPTM